MKIIFDRHAIIEAIAPLMCAVSGKSTLTAIEGILIEATAPDTCTLTTFDLEKGVQITIHPEVIEGGSYIINAQKFNQTVKAMSGSSVTLTVDDKLTATFESGKFSHTLGALAGSDFPEVPRPSGEHGFIIKQGIFRKMLSKVMHAMAVNDQRPVLNGCYVRIVQDSIMTVACDTFRIAKCAMSCEIGNINTAGSALNFSFVIPNKTVAELQRMLSDSEEEDIHIALNRKTMMTKIGEITFFSRLIMGEYIDFDRAIAVEHSINITLDREPMLGALERASLITEERIAGCVRAHVKLDLEGEILKVVATSTAGSTYDELPVEHEGEDLLIAFNNRYLLDALRACTADRIRIAMSSARTPINITPVQEESEDGVEKSELFFLLPIRF